MEARIIDILISALIGSIPIAGFLIKFMIKIKEDISGIKTDLLWIKNSIKK